MSKVIKSSLLTLAISITLFLPISFPFRGWCSQSGSKTSKTASRKDAVPPTLRPEQERGLRLLKTAAAESAGLQPDMHAFVLWRASYAYTKLDPKQADKLSWDAFTATQAMEDASGNDRCAAMGSAGDMKSWIQQHVLYDMVHKGQLREVEQRLPQATAPVRNQITAELVKYYQSKKDLIHAESLLLQLADSANYPFGPAADLLTALGAEQSADRMSIFNQALNNYEQHAMETSFGGEDIGSFIERTWQDVPPALVLEAIDKILDKAKERGSQSHYAMSSAKGSIVLNSDYALRLFQLLPILEELDKDKAESFLREQTELAEQLKTYPRGMQSLNSEDTSFSYGVADNGSGLGNATSKQQLEAQIQARVVEILKRAETDPSVALVNALSLPIHGTFASSSPRSRALLGIAEKAAVKKASVAKSALDEFSSIQDQLTLQEMMEIDRLPELYLKIGDIDGAKKAVDILVKAGNKTYENDTDADDPNKAFKGAWPSTDLWRKAIEQATKISPGFPEEIISGLQDSEIATFEKVALASALVGGSAIDATFLVSDCRNNGATFRVSTPR
jgi:hypothetical protein